MPHSGHHTLRAPHSPLPTPSPPPLQVLYRLSEKRAAELLTTASGKAKLPILSVPRFLDLFSAANEAAAGGAGGGKEPIKPNKVDRLSAREQKLLLTMRDYLFEQHSRMQNMFRRCDPDVSRLGLGMAQPFSRPSVAFFSRLPSPSLLTPSITFSRLLPPSQGNGYVTIEEFLNASAYAGLDPLGYSPPPCFPCLLLTQRSSDRHYPPQ